MCTHHTTDERQLADRLLCFLEAVNIPRLQTYLRDSLTSYLQANFSAYHQQFVGMVGDMEFLFALLDDLAKVQESMHQVP